MAPAQPCAQGGCAVGTAGARVPCGQGPLAPQPNKHKLKLAAPLAGLESAGSCEHPALGMAESTSAVRRHWIPN